MKILESKNGRCILIISEKEVKINGDVIGKEQEMRIIYLN